MGLRDGCQITASKIILCSLILLHFIFYDIVWVRTLGREYTLKFDGKVHYSPLPCILFANPI